MRDLEEKLHKTEDDARQSKARLDTITKAMGSLQDDRDRVLSQYKQLEDRHLQVRSRLMHHSYFRTLYVVLNILALSVYDREGQSYSRICY